ncbi:ChrR family anti-sigma-E factor [Seohaeicola saemankumensis]|nr:ChrR family anti-sigma-E factor [Seohaeicola saemankumensis]MCA0872472.1 ChrR family anti-sigma-E factor [Seohaeicola saemankumensis]
MSKISHHLPESVLAAYAAGSLPYAYAMVAAAHVSMCAECRAIYEAHQCAGGLVLDDMEGMAVSQNTRRQLMDSLDLEAPPEPPAPRAFGVYPAPVAELLGDGGPRWRKVGGGVRQQILHYDDAGSIRLLSIPPGRAVPDHSHGGLELTLVLQGSFSDETGQFGCGDVEVGDPDLEHTPTAGEEGPCICLAATDAPLRFRSLVPRLIQPLLRI